MKVENKIQLFEKYQVRTVWDEENEKWWFSVLDIIAVLTDQSDYKKVRNYWKWLKKKLKEEGSNLFDPVQMSSDINHLNGENQLGSDTTQLKIHAADQLVNNALSDETQLVSDTTQLKIHAETQLVSNTTQLKIFDEDQLVNNALNDETQLVSNTTQLKMLAADGKYYKTDVADIEQILRLIQSMPSKKAEPFKQWLARVGRERIDEIIDPELSIDRAIQNYRRLGYSENWINQRIKSIEVRKALTDEWDKAGVKQGKEYAFLTDLMTKTWSGMTTHQYKRHKNLTKENLRDNMTNLELIINMLSEATATELSTKSKPQNLQQSAQIAQTGASVALNARLDIEQKGGKVISSQNAKQIGTKNKQNKIDNK